MYKNIKTILLYTAAFFTLLGYEASGVVPGGQKQEEKTKEAGNQIAIEVAQAAATRAQAAAAQAAATRAQAAAAQVAEPRAQVAEPRAQAAAAQVAAPYVGRGRDERSFTKTPEFCNTYLLKDITEGDWQVALQKACAAENAENAADVASPSCPVFCSSEASAPTPAPRPVRGADVAGAPIPASRCVSRQSLFEQICNIDRSQLKSVGKSAAPANAAPAKGPETDLMQQLRDAIAQRLSAIRKGTEGSGSSGNVSDDGEWEESDGAKK